MAENGDVVINALAISDAPADYEVPGSQHFVPLVVEAVIDGSGAAGTFIPAVVLLAPSGDVIGRGMARPVAAGSSAEVTFRPFLSDTPGEGVRFDTDPQTGNFLHVETVGTDAGGPGISLRAEGADGGAGGIALRTFQGDTPSAFGPITLNTDGGSITADAGTGGAIVLSCNGGFQLFEGGGGIIINEQVAGGLILREHGGGLTIEENNGGGLSINENGGGGLTIGELGGGSLRIVGDGGIVVTIDAAGTMCVFEDSLAAPIFEIRADGSIHGRAAVGAITWDL